MVGGLSQRSILVRRRENGTAIVDPDIVDRLGGKQIGPLLLTLGNLEIDMGIAIFRVVIQAQHQVVVVVAFSAD